MAAYDLCQRKYQFFSTSSFGCQFGATSWRRKKRDVRSGKLVNVYGKSLIHSVSMVIAALSCISLWYVACKLDYLDLLKGCCMNLLLMGGGVKNPKKSFCHLHSLGQ